MKCPNLVKNWIHGEETASSSGKTFHKMDPARGRPLCEAVRSNAFDVDRAVEAASLAQPFWAETPPVQRGSVLHEIVKELQQHQDHIAEIVSAETGKSLKEARGETGGAIALGLFYAGEGQRLYGRTTTSGVADKYAMTVRQPMGVAGLIVAANTPIANVAWKVFPALICGNSAVLKAAEDTPATAWAFARIAQKAGLPAGVLNVVQGFGEEAGAPLVGHPKVDVISFTGSAGVGRSILRATADQIKKVSLELGGKNPLVVCDDADLEKAAQWALLSAFSNAGQRCASGSRILVFAQIYEAFREMLLEKAAHLKLGPGDDDDLGPVINERQLETMLRAVEQAREKGATVSLGGHRLMDPDHRTGYYMAPTILEHVSPEDAISTTELFGPIVCLYQVEDFQEALSLADDSPYGLTACIHTRNVNRAVHFAQRVRSGVAVINGGTYGSEPHMPFGGLRQSGNGTREPGTEALDVYSELKDIYICVQPGDL